MSALRYRALDAVLGVGLLPDVVLRMGSRFCARRRETRESRGGVEGREGRLNALLQRMTTGPIAEVPAAANEQHYELPAEFFGVVLGPHRKYSACLWEQDTRTLAEAEDAMLGLTCERAEISDGARVLDLGCGWGSLSLWLAQRYPSAEITGVSNSHSQREWITAQAVQRGLRNLTILTADVNEFTPVGQFDRVVSIEMFEHMRNWQELLRRISTWLTADGKLFVHVFSHRTLPYVFKSTWASERFFTAGLMPSHDLLPRFQRDLHLERQWTIDGTHYAKTLAAWLDQLDDHRPEALAALAGSAPPGRRTLVLLASWRLFLISATEMWGYRDGDAWLVSHYLMRNGAP